VHSEFDGLDLDMALQLLRQAGHPDAFEGTISGNAGFRKSSMPCANCRCGTVLPGWSIHGISGFAGTEVDREFPIRPRRRCCCWSIWTASSQSTMSFFTGNLAGDTCCSARWAQVLARKRPGDGYRRTRYGGDEFGRYPSDLAGPRVAA